MLECIPEKWLPVILQTGSSSISFQDVNRLKSCCKILCFILCRWSILTVSYKEILDATPKEGISIVSIQILLQHSNPKFTTLKLFCSVWSETNIFNFVSICTPTSTNKELLYTEIAQQLSKNNFQFVFFLNYWSTIAGTSITIPAISVKKIWAQKIKETIFLKKELQE